MLLHKVYVLLACALATTAIRSRQHVGMQDERRTTGLKRTEANVPRAEPLSKRVSPYLTAASQKFAVDGTSLPNVTFDIGESYAGLLPISTDPDETRQLYFWFFPSSNPAASNEITLWLNGGPGCSSLEGLFQENGPVIWQYGTFLPVKNPYTWVNLTNVVWVEQPVGTGFSQGKPNATSEVDVAAQFMGFFKNFVDTFGIQNRKVYIAGESYAGYYVPYIADAMLNANDTTYFDLTATMIYDPSTSTTVLQEQIPVVAFVDYWSHLFSLNQTYMNYLHNQSDYCNYTSYMNEYLVFPPKGTQPVLSRAAAGCSLWNAVFDAALEINPCFDEYQIATTCPVLWDELGFPGSFDYVPAGASIYFNRSDVKAAIHAPQNVSWMECTNTRVFVNGTDHSLPSGLSVLPSVIERSQRTVIGHGALDMILIANGTLLMIQNMTWNGAMGFQQKPSDEFYVPYHKDWSDSTLAGAGVFGTTHTERGLTFVEVSLSGHMIPQYAPSASYRTLEFLLGRIPSLTTVGDFTTQTGNYTG